MMTKPTMELIEDYAAEHALLQIARMCKMPDAAEDHADMKLRHFAEIRQRIEAMERREEELESDLAEAAKCAFQYAAKVGELERDAARYRWLRYNASFTIHSFLFGEPSMAHHAESDLDAAIDQQLEQNP